MSTRRTRVSRLDRGSISIALVLGLLLLALWMPRVELPRDSYDYIVVFDISQSMNVEDYELDGAPISRLDYARETVRRVLPRLPCGSRIGWGAFTGYQTLLLMTPVEVCENYNDLLASIARIDGRMRWSNASEVTKGVYWSVVAAQATEQRPDIVFMTDGHEAPPLDPVYAPRLFEDLKGPAIQGWLIGVGALLPSPIPKIDEEGRRQGYWRSTDVLQGPSTGESPAAGGEQLSGLREAHLGALAEQIGFQFTRLVDAAGLYTAMSDPRFARRRWMPTDISWLAVALAMGLLAFRFRPD
ncbi:MAG: vWA domain-containing protein [Pseudomonadota bacterium]|nr:vWA domain-containing protein [Pseudomonadota bacterium]